MSFPIRSTGGPRGRRALAAGAVLAAAALLSPTSASAAPAPDLTGRLVFQAPKAPPASGAFLDLATLRINGVRLADTPGLDLSRVDLLPYLHDGANTLDVLITTTSRPGVRYSSTLDVGNALRSVDAAYLDVADLTVNGRAIPDPATLDLSRINLASYVQQGANTVDVPVTVAR